MPPANRKGKPSPWRSLLFVGVVLVALYGGMVASGLLSPKLGLDLQGGSSVTLTPVATKTGSANNVPKSALDESVSIIRQRVNGLGVSEASVTTEGKNIVVSVPGKKEEGLLKLVGTTAQLRFRMVCLADPSGAPLTTKPKAAPCPGKNNSGELPTPLANTTDAQRTPSDAVLTKYQKLDCTNPKSDQRLSVPDRPKDKIVATCGKDGAKYLLSQVILTGDAVNTASAQMNSSHTEWTVNLNWKTSGKKQWVNLTTVANINTYAANDPNARVAIVLDGVVQSAPSTQEAITTDDTQITGNFTHKSAGDLASVLKYGALPITLKSQNVVNVSATLGKDQLIGGMIAGAIGIGLVVLYSFLYYRGLGFITILSLVMSAAMLWPLICLLGVSIGFTLSLAGIAGLIMAIGVTVDSFVVYFERLRDEVREGRTVRSAVDRGWIRARRTIISADAVSLIGAVILYWLSISDVRGFAFTLGMSTVIDLFIIFFVTKPLISLLARTKFYGEGHKFSGLDAGHMGMKRREADARRPRPATVGGGAK